MKSEVALVVAVAAPMLEVVAVVVLEAEAAAGVEEPASFPSELAEEQFATGMQEDPKFQHLVGQKEVVMSELLWKQ